MAECILKLGLSESRGHIYFTNLAKSQPIPGIQSVLLITMNTLIWLPIFLDKSFVMYTSLMKRSWSVMLTINISFIHSTIYDVSGTYKC